jgi:hypothetical protein
MVVVLDGAAAAQPAPSPAPPVPDADVDDEEPAIVDIDEPEPPADVSERAVELYQEGRAFAGESDWAQACARFQDSYALMPAMETNLRIADCLYQQGYLWRAWQIFDNAKIEADTGRRRVARMRAAEIEAELAVVTVTQEDSGQELFVTIDGRETGPGPIRELVDPGRVRIVAIGADGARYVTRVTAMRGKEVTVEIPALSQIVERKDPRWLAVSRVLVVAGAATFVIGTPLAGDHGDVAMLGGLAMAAIGGIVYARAPTQQIKEVFVAPAINRGSGGLVLSGSF